MKEFCIALFATLLFSVSGFAETLLNVYTVNYPLTYFAERIGGDRVKVTFPAPPDVDPAFWNPEEETVREYQKADLIILNGAGYAKWTSKVSLPMLRTVDTSKSFRADLITIETNVTHNHGPKGDHSHGGIAFTTWLDMSQSISQAEAIYLAFSRKLPQFKKDFEADYVALKEDLLELDDMLQGVGKRLAGEPLLGSHPIYQYLARRYNLNLKMVMWEPDLEPDTQQWLKLEKTLQKHPASLMIWEGEPLSNSSEKLKALGVKSLVFSPCFSKPSTGDFLSVMEQNILILSSTGKHL